MRTEILKKRLAELGMTQVTLAERTGLSVPTIKRTLSGRWTRIETLSRIAEALGMKMEIRFEASKTAHQFRNEQAIKKAKDLVRMTQGTSALEAQAVDECVLDDAIEQTTAELVAGPSRRLWQ
jgi:transcriptional regulator with XRE-family HTH domain